MSTPRIFFVTPDINSPTGGIKQLYRQVDVLNNNGFNAFILHQKEGFKCTWFQNNTKIAYHKTIFEDLENLIKESVTKDYSALLKFKIAASKTINNFLSFKKTKNTIITNNDVFVFAEVYGPNISTLLKGNKKVIYNQGAYQTFFHYDLDLKNKQTPYLDSELVATIVNSEDAKNYIRYTFPNMIVNRVKYGIDSKIFYFNENKKKKIAFMPRRLRVDLIQVINILKFRGKLQNWELVEIHNMNEAQVADNLRNCAFFLSFSINEGFGMPPAEAMACGCVVVGYSGKGGREFFKDDFCYPVQDRDVLAFATTLEKVMDEYELDSKPFIEKGKRASEFILSEYSMENEIKTIVDCWNNIPI
jgi:glycosyltransferase involved in cell wall biosynthesis